MLAAHEAEDEQHQHRRRQALELPLQYRRIRRYHPYFYKDWTLDGLSDEYCAINFRFSKAQICRLCDALEIGSITFPHRLKPSPELAFCILLRRLSFAGRWCDSCELFERSESYLSKVFTAVCEHLST